MGVAAVAGPTPRVSLVNMAPTPMLAAGVNEALAAGASAAEAAARAAEGTAPPDDLHGDVEYRSHLARALVERALTEARR